MAKSFDVTVIGGGQRATFDKLIVAIGRVANTRGLNAEAAGLKLDARALGDTTGMVKPAQS